MANDETQTAFFPSLPPYSLPPLEEEDDDLSDLRDDDRLLGSSPPSLLPMASSPRKPPEPRKKRKPRRSKQAAAEMPPPSSLLLSPASFHSHDHHRHGAGNATANANATALEHAAAGAALAGVMAGALGKPGGSAGGGPRGRLLWQLALVGVGAVYLGLLVYLWKRARDTEKDMKETAAELRKIAAFLESSETLEDEPLPARGPAAAMQFSFSGPPPRGTPTANTTNATTTNANTTINDVHDDPLPKVEELSMPAAVSPLPPLPLLTSAKKRKPPASKPAVINLDDGEDARTMPPEGPTPGAAEGETVPDPI